MHQDDNADHSFIRPKKKIAAEKSTHPSPSSGTSSKESDEPKSSSSPETWHEPRCRRSTRNLVKLEKVPEIADRYKTKQIPSAALITGALQDFGI